MERLKLTAAEALSGDGSSGGGVGGGTQQQHGLYASHEYTLRPAPRRLLNLRQSHACLLSGWESMKRDVLTCYMLRQGNYHQ